MVQTDYIMRIIEQFAAFLWAIVFNKKSQNNELENGNLPRNEIIEELNRLIIDEYSCQKLC